MLQNLNFFILKLFLKKLLINNRGVPESEGTETNAQITSILLAYR